jgi:hypothetical protein
VRGVARLEIQEGVAKYLARKIAECPLNLASGLSSGFELLASLGALGANPARGANRFAQPPPQPAPFRRSAHSVAPSSRR